MMFRNRAGGRVWPLAVVAGVMVACDLGSFISPSLEENHLTTLRVHAAVDSQVVAGLSVEIAAVDIDPPLAYDIPITDGVAGASVRVMAGSGRQFTLHAFDGNGIETHRGAETADVLSSDNPPLEITMVPLQGGQEISATIARFIVAVSPAAGTVLVGDSIQLLAAVMDSLGDPINQPTVQWGTLAPDVASVDSQGMVRGIGPGSTRIVATYESVDGSSLVQIAEEDIQAPTVPTDLNAAAVSSSRIDVSWSAADDDIGVAGYRIYRDGAQITEVTGLSYSDTGLNEATAYSYEVAAYDAVGNFSDRSTSVSATTPDAAGPGPAELPRSEVDFAMPTTSTTITVKASGGDYSTLQAAWDAISSSGRTANIEIVIDAGYDPGGISTGPQSGDDTYWVVIRSANSASLPRHVRVGPSDKPNMPQIVVPAGRPALDVEANTKRVRFVGVSTETGASSYSYNWNSDRDASHIIFDRCLLDGGYRNGYQTRVGFGMHGQHIGVIDSYIYDINENGSESKGILVLWGAGPFGIVNNFLEASSINILFGGTSIPSIDYLPQDITFARNYSYTNPAWAADGNAVKKNLFEVKHGERFLIEHNAFENSWSEGQSYAILLKSVDPSETAHAQHVTFRYNTVENFDDGLNMAAQPTNQNTGTGALLPLWYMSVHDNLFTNGGEDNPHNQHTTNRAVAMFDDLAFLSFRNNDFRGDFNNGVVFEGEGKTDLVFENNIIGTNGYVFQNGHDLDALAPGHSVTGNILAPGQWATVPEGNCITWPPPDANCAGAGVQTARHAQSKSGDFSSDPWSS